MVCVKTKLLYTELISARANSTVYFLCLNLSAYHSIAGVWEQGGWPGGPCPPNVRGGGAEYHLPPPQKKKKFRGPSRPTRLSIFHS